MAEVHTARSIGNAFKAAVERGTVAAVSSSFRISASFSNTARWKLVTGGTCTAKEDGS